MDNNLYNQNPQNYNSKNTGPRDNYYGKKKRDEFAGINQNIDDGQNFKTNKKIKITLYKNGFIINHGKFREKSIPENHKFMKEVEKGMIPEELILNEPGNFELSYVDKKNEVYVNQARNPISTTLEAYIHGNLNQNVNQNINNNDSQNLYLNNIPQVDNNLYNNININPPLNIQQQNYPGGHHHHHHQNNQNQQKHTQQHQNQIINNKDIRQEFQPQTSRPNRRRQKIEIDNMSLTPIGMRNERKNIFVGKKENPNENKILEPNMRKSISVPKKKEEKKFRTFASLIKEEKIKEEEEKQKKKGKKSNTNEEKEEKKEKEKKFTAFAGSGKIIDNVNTQGLHVEKGVETGADKSKPMCTINIRLFNGEIIKSEFNYSQTLREIYYYVQKISGSNNFHLLDGFPPKKLRDYDKTIEYLKLENTTLTQKIK